MSKRVLTLVLLFTLVSAGVSQATPTKPCELVKALQSGRAETVQDSIRALVGMGEMAAAPLVCYLAGMVAGIPTPTEAGKANAEKALVKLGKHAVPAIVSHLRNKSADTRMRLVRVLAQIPDARRVTPLMDLWRNEKVDAVRAALVGALVAVQGSKAVSLLRQRITAAGPLERIQLAAHLALRGTVEDLRKLWARVPLKSRPAFAASTVARVRAIGGPAVSTAVKRLKSLASAK